MAPSSDTRTVWLSLVQFEDLEFEKVPGTDLGRTLMKGVPGRFGFLADGGLVQRDQHEHRDQEYADHRRGMITDNSSHFNLPLPPAHC